MIFSASGKWISTKSRMQSAKSIIVETVRKSV
jgi:hypothetical protein